MPRYTWEDAPAANGPKLAEWLEQGRLKDVKTVLFGYAFDRAIRHWRHGTHPSFFTVDKFLGLLGMHPVDVPDEVWDDLPDRSGPRPPTTPPRFCESCGEKIHRPRIPCGQLEKPEKYLRRTHCEGCAEARAA